LKSKTVNNKDTALTNSLFNTTAAVLQEKNSFIVVGHISPDGDAIGSALALYHFLAEQGKQVKVGWGEKISMPSQYLFLPAQSRLETIAPESATGEETLIAVDVATEERLGSAKSLLAKLNLVINIDHHLDNTCFGNLNLIDPQASSTAEIVYALMKRTGKKIRLNVATCLYVALATDTGQFQYANTTAAAFKMAAELVALGVEPNLISQNLYESHSLPKLKLLGKALNKAVYEPELKLIYTYLDKDDLKETGATPADTERLTDHLRAVEGVNLAMLIKAFDKEIKVSLRAKDEFDVRALANQFGGGGHKAAAGFIYHGSVEQLISEVKHKLSAKLSHSL